MTSTAPPVGHLGDVLGDDDERVGVRQAGDQVRARAADRRHDVPARRRRRASRAGTGGVPAGDGQRLAGTTARTVGPVQRLDAEHPADRRPHEHLERHVRLTGLPGSAKIGVLSGPMVPKPCGLPGCMATCSNRTVPSRDSTSLTTSYAPTLTPPLVTTRSARTSWSSIASSSVLRVVGDDADPVGDGAGLAGGGGEDVGVRVVDLARRERLAGLDQLAAGGDDDDPRAGAGPDPVAADRGEQPDLPGPEAGAGVEHRARRRARPRRPGGCARRPRARWVMRTAGEAAVGPLDRDDRVGAGRHRRAGHDPRRRGRAARV